MENIDFGKYWDTFLEMAVTYVPKFLLALIVANIHDRESQNVNKDGHSFATSDLVWLAKWFVTITLCCKDWQFI